jgi:GNAT superfamily N-acetyltransferase
MKGSAMISSLRYRYFQFVEHWEEYGFLSACRIICYRYEEVVPTEKPLDNLRPVPGRKDDNLHILDLDQENFTSQVLEFPRRSRRERAKNYFRRGYRMLALVRQGKVIGDLWYVTRATARTPQIHPHLRWFGIDLAEDEVYLFDMYIDPRERGGGVATFFLGSVLHMMHDRGLRKSYGCYAAEHVQALWLHRLIGFRELPHCEVRRILLYESGRGKG